MQRVQQLGLPAGQLRQQADVHLFAVMEVDEGLPLHGRGKLRIAHHRLDERLDFLSEQRVDLLVPVIGS